MKFLRTFLAAGFVIVAVTTVAAQTGGLRVTVYDAADKSPLPGVTVVLRNSQQLVATTTVITNKNGVADFPVLRAGGGFSLEVSFPGYGKQQLPNIRVAINQVQNVSFILAPEMTEKVVVEGKKETVDLDKTSTSTKFGEDFIQDLPVQGRFYQNMLTMAAGVQDPSGGGNPNVNGARNVDF
ncbi:MAG: carboxypeptidase-like regulatory domain-containing protein, partial [Acidobacteriia bacterium]|nr:carboxypeptidase-like regulatory domain-containing protein [Terriglobia bacterium]